MHSRVQDDPSQTNSSLEFWIVNLRLGFGVLGLRFLDFGLGTSQDSSQNVDAVSIWQPKKI